MSGSGAQLSGPGAQLSGSGAQLSKSGAQLSAISAYLHTSYLGAQLSASQYTLANVIKSEAKALSETSLQSISRYLFANYLHINIKKTKYVVFSSSAKNPPPCKITLDNTILQRVRCIKFLGVIIDERLNWANQTNSLICKLSKTCGTLRSLSSCLPKSLRAPVFSALVNSHIYNIWYHCLGWKLN